LIYRHGVKKIVLVLDKNIIFLVCRTLYRVVYYLRLKTHK
jgi:hypothetical protein